MKIVFIGDTVTTAADEHIAKCCKQGHEVYVPIVNAGEQLVRRIIDADEIHLFHVTPDDAFELGMVFFFTVHALHYRLHWEVKVFGGNEDQLRMFTQHEPDPDAVSILDGKPILMPIEIVPKFVPAIVRQKVIEEKPSCAVQGKGCKSVPACHDVIGECSECRDGGDTGDN